MEPLGPVVSKEEFMGLTRFYKWEGGRYPSNETSSSCLVTRKRSFETGAGDVQREGRVDRLRIESFVL